jgi:hypothetical protein
MYICSVNESYKHDYAKENKTPLANTDCTDAGNIFWDTVS